MDEQMDVYTLGGVYASMASSNLGNEKIYQGKDLIVSVKGSLMQFSHKSALAVEYVKRRNAVRATIGLDPWSETLTPAEQKAICRRAEFDATYFAKLAKPKPSDPEHTEELTAWAEGTPRHV